MNKVKLAAYNKIILVDEDQVKFHIKKSALVDFAMAIQSNMSKEPENSRVWCIYRGQISSISTKIISLNRKIRQNVKFVV